MDDRLHPCKAYSSEVSDGEWAFVAPYLRLMTPRVPWEGTTRAKSSIRFAGSYA